MNLQDAYSDFILSREAINVTPRTLDFYRYILNRIVESFRDQDVVAVNEITARHVRVLIKELRDKNLSDSYIHQHARVVKTFLRFCRKEGYIDDEIHFDMPKIASKHIAPGSLEWISLKIDFGPQKSGLSPIFEPKIRLRY